MQSTRDLFSQHNLRCTAQRAALYEALCACRSHPTAEELFQSVRASVDRLSRATVYNALEAFCRAGLARKLAMTTGCCRYDADMRDHLHIRFRDSSEIRDVPEDVGQRLLRHLPRSVLAEIERHAGATIEGINIQFVARRDAGQQGHTAA